MGNPNFHQIHFTTTRLESKQIFVVFRHIIARQLREKLGKLTRKRRIFRDGAAWEASLPGEASGGSF